MHLFVNVMIRFFSFCIFIKIYLFSCSNGCGHTCQVPKTLYKGEEQGRVGVKGPAASQRLVCARGRGCPSKT